MTEKQEEKHPMMPVQALALYAESKCSLSRAYLDLLFKVDKSKIPELRAESHWILIALEKFHPRGACIAQGFARGHSCERGYVFFLESLTARQVADFIKTAHLERIKHNKQRGFAVWKTGSLEEMISAMLSLLENGFREARKSLLGSNLRRHLGDDLEDLRNTYPEDFLMAETLIYITSWANKPDNDQKLKKVRGFVQEPYTRPGVLALPDQNTERTKVTTP